jgi:hypothetical protein
LDVLRGWAEKHWPLQLTATADAPAPHTSQFGPLLQSSAGSSGPPPGHETDRLTQYSDPLSEHVALELAVIVTETVQPSPPTDPMLQVLLQGCSGGPPDCTAELGRVRDMAKNTSTDAETIAFFMSELSPVREALLEERSGEALSGIDCFSNHRLRMPALHSRVEAVDDRQTEVADLPQGA